jgi:predicted dehydrogenase
VAASAAGLRHVVAGLIGGGFMGDVHSRALRAAGVQIAGIASSSAESAERAAGSLGIERSYRDTEELLADERVTLVHVLTPNSTHEDLVMRALDAGKHVICEKPLAVSSESALRMQRRAEELGLVGAVPFVYRFHSMAREAQAQIQRGQIGKLFSVRGEYLQDWLLNPADTNWRVAAELGGASRTFADIGIHLCDLMEFVCGDRIERLVAQTQSVYSERASKPVDTEDLVAVMARLSGGAVVSLLVSQVAAGHKNGLVLEIHASEAALRFEQERPDELWVGGQSRSSIMPRDPGQLDPAAQRHTFLPAGHPEGYLDAFTRFVRDVVLTIQGQAVAGLPVFADGVRAAQLTEAVLKSAASNDWVTVPAA